MPITVENDDPFSAASQKLIEALSDTLATITGDSGKRNVDLQDFTSLRAVWVLAKDEQGEARGCGALRPLSDEVAELKRMYSDGGKGGVGAAILEYLENAARQLGYREIWLETRKVNVRAVNFYLKHGYKQTANTDLMLVEKKLSAFPNYCRNKAPHLRFIIELLYCGKVGYKIL